MTTPRPQYQNSTQRLAQALKDMAMPKDAASRLMGFMSQREWEEFAETWNRLSRKPEDHFTGREND